MLHTSFCLENLMGYGAVTLWVAVFWDMGRFVVAVV